MQITIHGDGRRFAPEPGQETPMAEQYARLRYRATQLEQLVELLAEKYSSNDVYGQYFYDKNLRDEDLGYLNAQFTPTKRLKRRIVRALRRYAVGRGLHEAYEARKREIGRVGLHPLTISADDFAFDRPHLAVPKWFLCLCHK